MTDLRTAAQQALDALEGVFEGDEKGAQYWTVTGGTYEAVYCKHAITALKAALEQPEQCGRCGKVTRPGDVHTCTPRRLTDEVIADLWHQNGTYHHHFARAIERWLKAQE
jgi:recombinational DNA repair protein RecR